MIVTASMAVRAALRLLDRQLTHKLDYDDKESDRAEIAEVKLPLLYADESIDDWGDRLSPYIQILAILLQGAKRIVKLPLLDASTASCRYQFDRLSMRGMLMEDGFLVQVGFVRQ
jgi:hypothetical protein